jgi:hypothetical protein
VAQVALRETDRRSRLQTRGRNRINPQATEGLQRPHHGQIRYESWGETCSSFEIRSSGVALGGGVQMYFVSLLDRRSLRGIGLKPSAQRLQGNVDLRRWALGLQPRSGQRFAELYLTWYCGRHRPADDTVCICQGLAGDEAAGVDPALLDMAPDRFTGQMINL